MILPHRHPGVGDDQIGARDGFACVAHDVDANAPGARRLDEARIGFIALWPARADVKAEQPGRFDERRQNIVSSADASDVRPSPGRAGTWVGNEEGSQCRLWWV